MRTHPDFLRRGAAAAILETIIATAKDRGVKQLTWKQAAAPPSNQR